MKNQIKELSENYLKTKDFRTLKALEAFIRNGLKLQPNDNELAMRLALTLFAQAEGREDEIITILQQILPSSPLYYKAILITAYAQERIMGINKEMRDQLLELTSPDNALESMKYYMMSGFFMHQSDYAYRTILEKSVALCDKHVWNLVTLAQTYQKNDNDMCKMLLCQALDNVEFVGSDYKPDEDITDIDRFLKAHISGLYLTTSHLQFIVNDLRPFPHKMSWEK